MSLEVEYFVLGMIVQAPLELEGDDGTTQYKRLASSTSPLHLPDQALLRANLIYDQIMASRLVYLTALSLVLGCTGCSMSDVSLMEAPPVLQFNPFDTPESRPDIFLTGGLSGKLFGQGQCVIVGSSTGKVTPLWPLGTQLISSEGRVVVELPNKRGSAQLGDIVKLSGSTLRRDEEHRLPKMTGQPCPRSYFLVSGVQQQEQ